MHVLYVYVCLQDEGVVRSRDIHLLGHSLGAHLQAYTGSHYQTISGGEKVYRLAFSLSPSFPAYVLPFLSCIITGLHHVC